MFKNRKNAFFIFIFIILFQFSAIADTLFTYSEVQISVPNKTAFRQLARQGLIFDHIKIIRKNSSGLVFKTVLNNLELNILKKSGLSYQILVPDVVKAYRERQAAQTYSFQRSSDLPAGFELGSMGGYYTFDEVVTELDSMHLNHPDLITARQSIGLSIESRDLWMVKISDNPETDEEEPEVLYTALHHAREPAGMMALMYFMDYLLDNYNSDPEVTYLVNHRQLYFVPVVNPDGYVYNQQTNPDGGGQWRKNRRNNGNGWYGVDLNRNYGYKWGYDDYGSSPYPFSDTYRGQAPFSEPETQAMRDFVQSRRFVLAINYHTYSDLLIYPWGYIDALTPDSITYKNYATILTDQNRYNFGTGEETVNYLVNGDSDDWLYGEQSAKSKVLALTPEVGSDDDGFWPDQSRIVPLCKENLRANLNLAWLAGGRLELQNFRIVEDDNQNGFPDQNETVRLVCHIKNIGQGQAPNVTLSLLADDPYVTTKNAGDYSYAQIPAGNLVADTFSVGISPDAPSGHSATLYVRIEQDGFVYQDTLQKFIVGTPTVVFADDAESGMDQWNSGQGWGIVAADSGHCFTDSPQGKYANNADNALTLNSALVLPPSDAIFLTFRTHWDIERPFDFATVELSSDSMNWQTVQAHDMISASGKGKQTAGTFGYDGFTSYWHDEWIDITSFQEQNTVYLRFRLQSDGSNQRDGWYVDNIHVLAYNALPSLVKNSSGLVPQQPKLLPNFPDPFNMETSIPFYLPFTDKATVAVYDVNGRKVRSLLNGVITKGWHRLLWNGTDDRRHTVSSGIYFIRLQTRGTALSEKIVLLK